MPRDFDKYVYFDVPADAVWISQLRNKDTGKFFYMATITCPEGTRMGNYDVSGYRFEFPTFKEKRDEERAASNSGEKSWPMTFSVNKEYYDEHKKYDLTFGMKDETGKWVEDDRLTIESVNELGDLSYGIHKALKDIGKWDEMQAARPVKEKWLAERSQEKNVAPVEGRAPAQKSVAEKAEAPKRRTQAKEDAPVQEAPSKAKTV